MPTLQISESTKRELHVIQSQLIYVKSDKVSMNDVLIVLINQRKILNDIIQDETNEIHEKYLLRLQDE